MINNYVIERIKVNVAKTWTHAQPRFKAERPYESRCYQISWVRQALSHDLASMTVVTEHQKARNAISIARLWSFPANTEACSVLEMS